MEIDSAAKVQHLTKATSDELLSKFSEVGSESDKNNKPANVTKELRLSKRQKRSRTNPDGASSCLAERKSLLPPASRRSGALIRRLGIGRAKLRARNLRNKSLFGTMEKTWRKTVEGASKVFIEKHYNRHKRLINDIA